MSIDPKLQIDKIAKHIRNPQNAAALESIEQTSHLSDIKERLDKPLEVSVNNHPKQEFPDKIKVELDGSPAERAAKFFSLLQGEKGKDGVDGHTPTEEEIKAIIEPLIPQPIAGRDGVDGKDADETKIIREVVAKIPKPKDGQNADEEKIVKQVLDRMSKEDKDAPIHTVIKTVIKHITNLKPKEKISLRAFKEGEDLIGKVALHSNMMSRMPKSLLEGDQRWGGHGGSSGGGFTLLTTTSTVDGNNQTFVFSTATTQPSLVVKDGVMFTALDSNGATQWSWTQATKTVTLTISPPDNSIFAIA